MNMFEHVSVYKNKWEKACNFIKKEILAQALSCDF